ncbi:MAG: hypothetical protein AAFP13_01870 [Pseudomonadota bacterium]
MIKPVPAAAIAAQRRSDNALRRARAHLADPSAKLSRLLAAYAQLQQQHKVSWSLPEA